MSFLPDSDNFAGFLQASLERMHAECLPAYSRLCELLEGRKVHLLVDSEVLCLSFDTDGISVQPIAEAYDVSEADIVKGAMVSMHVSRRTILNLVDGQISLQDGILDGRVGVQGGIAELLLFHEGWLTYMRGAARCSSFPYLLERFRYATNMGLVTDS